MADSQFNSYVMLTIRLRLPEVKKAIMDRTSLTDDDIEAIASRTGSIPVEALHAVFSAVGVELISTEYLDALFVLAKIGAEREFGDS